jgi:Ca-activated chloride channel homolog
MSFQSPWFLLSLALLGAAVGIWLLAERRRMRYAVHFPNVDVLATVVSGRSWARLVPAILVGLALALLLAALARPHVTRMFLSEKATVILVVDTSRSMQAEDVAPTRLGAAQEAIRTFLDDVPDRLNVGLVVFAGDTQVATPPTKNRALLEEAVNTIDSFSVFGGTAIGDALDTAVDLGKRVSEDETRSGDIALGERRQLAAVGQTRRLAQTQQPCEEDGPVSILFLSDGAQTRGILQPLEGAALARDACIPVYTIALGTPEGIIDRGTLGGGFPSDSGPRFIPVPPDPETLRAIAEMTGGEFSEARSADSLERAYSSLGSRLGREPGESEVTFLFVALAAVLLVLAGVAGTFVAPRLP